MFSLLQYASADAKNSVFITGCHSMKLESITKHEESNVHKKCIAIDEAKKKTILDTQATKIVRTSNEDNFRKMKILFNTAHALAIKNRPFTDFKWLCNLQTKNDIQLGETYINANASKTFVNFIAMTELSRICKQINNTQFTCVIGDGSTNSSVKEQEMWFLRYASILILLALNLVKRPWLRTL